MELFGAGIGVFMLIVLVMVLAGLVAFVVHVVAIVDVARAPEPEFGPWWDNTRSSWLIGLVVAFLLPAGSIVAAILWWLKVRTPRSQGRPPERPFWAGPPKPQPPYPPPGYGPPPPGYGPPPPGYGPPPAGPGSPPP